jgi:hypothetical protein
MSLQIEQIDVCVYTGKVLNMMFIALERHAPKHEMNRTRPSLRFSSDEKLPRQSSTGHTIGFDRSDFVRCERAKLIVRVRYSRRRATNCHCTIIKCLARLAKAID